MKHILHSAYFVYNMLHVSGEVDRQGDYLVVWSFNLMMLASYSARSAFLASMAL